MNTPRLTDIRLHQQSRLLELIYENGERFNLSCEYLRVFSPSAEVRGHGPGQEVLVTGKEDVTITTIEPVGNYGVKLVFSDGHDTGIYDWNYLYELAENQAGNWKAYLERLSEAGYQRNTKA